MNLCDFSMRLHQTPWQFEISSDFLTRYLICLRLVWIYARLIYDWIFDSWIYQNGLTRMTLTGHKRASLTSSFNCSSFVLTFSIFFVRPQKLFQIIAFQRAYLVQNLDCDSLPTSHVKRTECGIVKHLI